MIKCRVAELSNPGTPQQAEVHIGWCYFPVAPIDIHPDFFPPDHRPQPGEMKQPANFSIGNANYMIIGFKWEVDELPISSLTADAPTINLMIAVVRNQPTSPILKAPAAALDVLNSAAKGGNIKLRH